MQITPRSRSYNRKSSSISIRSPDRLAWRNKLGDTNLVTLSRSSTKLGTQILWHCPFQAKNWGHKSCDTVPFKHRIGDTNLVSLSLASTKLTRMTTLTIFTLPIYFNILADTFKNIYQHKTLKIFLKNTKKHKIYYLQGE